MSFNKEKLLKIIPEKDFINTEDVLKKLYLSPYEDGKGTIPVASVFPRNSEQVLKLMRFFREVKNFNIVIKSSNLKSNYLNHSIKQKNTIILDLSKMKNISFINKRNRVCVVEPGVTFKELVTELKNHHMRPLAPFLPPSGKSVLSSALERNPHMIPKNQWDISDPLLCLEVIFGNGELFRTGEAAGPQSIEKNRAFGAALTNPLGPGQLDLFRIIQGSRGTFGAVTWASIQCDEIPEKRIISFVQNDSINAIVEFLYKVVRRRWIDEVFIINKGMFKTIFRPLEGDLKKYIMIFSNNGYKGYLPDEKVAYQFEDCLKILQDLNLNRQESIADISQQDIEPILDGEKTTSHEDFYNNSVPYDVYYNTTLDRIQEHLNIFDELIRENDFPMERANVYIQPVIQARSVFIKFTLLADTPKSNSHEYSLTKVKTICRNLAEKMSSLGAFFSYSYDLIDDIAFSEQNQEYSEALKKLKNIFDPDNILNKGVMIF